MSKEVQMTFPIDTELRSQFVAAASAQNRPPVDVLREFMQEYVNQSRECVPAATADEIASAELRRRKDAWEFARASVALEGFEPTAVFEAAARELVAGNVTVAEFMEKNILVEQPDDNKAP